MTFRSYKVALPFIMLQLIVSAIWFNCSKTTESPPGEKPMTIEQAQKKHQAKIMKLTGVVGIGIGEVRTEKVIKVMVVKRTPELEKKIPKQIEGYPVVIEETGKIQAF
jgi:hypothetical protein